MLANPQKKKKSRVQGSGALGKPAPKAASSAWSQPATIMEDGDEEEREPQVLEPIRFTTGLRVMHEERPYPPGLFKQLNFITEDEELALVDRIEKGRWSNELSRRTQQYGYRFCYLSNELEEAPPIPEYYDAIIDKLCQVVDADGIPVFPQRPNQLIVNEYNPGQGINPHVDREIFEDGIVSISLLSDIQMIFDADLSHTGRRTIIETDPQQKMQIQPLTDSMVPVWLDRRSLIVMREDSRYKWSHEIPARAHDEKNGRIVRRKRRISVTFRVVQKQFRNLQKAKAEGNKKTEKGVDQLASGAAKLSLGRP